MRSSARCWRQRAPRLLAALAGLASRREKILVQGKGHGDYSTGSCVRAFGLTWEDGEGFLLPYMGRRKGHSRIQRLVEALRAYQPERVYLFGSWARGEEDDLSDLDVVVIKRTTLPFFERLREVAKALPLEEGGVDVLVYTPDEFEAMQREGNAFAEMIAEEGRLIYARQTGD